jgi:hypothetical protein
MLNDRACHHFHHWPRLRAQVLGKGGEADRARNLAAILDGYFEKGGHHINVNVLNREMLMDAVCKAALMFICLGGCDRVLGLLGG